MQIRDINKPINSKTLNETLAKKFGTRLDTDSFTLEQLQDARNKVRTKLSQIETNESFSGLPKNETYSKNKLFLDILNAAISERADIAEEGEVDSMRSIGGVGGDSDTNDNVTSMRSIGGVGGDNDNISSIGQRTRPLTRVEKIKSSPDYVKAQKAYMDALGRKDRVTAELLKMAIKQKFGVGLDEGKDQDEDGDKDFADVQIARMVKSGMSKADAIKKVKDKEYNEGQYANDAQRKAVHAAKDKKKKNESIVKEGAEDKAELVMAAKDMVDRLTGWMEDTAEMQSESMLELADAIRDEMSQQDSDSFVNTVKPALEQLYASMETTRESLTAGVSMLTGEGGMPAPDMGDIPADVEPEETEMEPTTADDEFAAAAPAAGGEEEAGRARRESRMYKKKAMLEQARRLGTILSKKK